MALLADAPSWLSKPPEFFRKWGIVDHWTETEYISTFPELDFPSNTDASASSSDSFVQACFAETIITIGQMSVK